MATTPIAVQVAGPEPYELTRTARSFCAVVVVTCPPPPSSTLPAGQDAVAVVRTFRAAFAAEVVPLVPRD